LWKLQFFDHTNIAIGTGTHFTNENETYVHQPIFPRCENTRWKKPASDVIGKSKDISIALSLKPNLVQVNLSIKFGDIKYLKTCPHLPLPQEKENYITLSDKKKQTYSNISSNKNTVNKT